MTDQQKLCYSTKDVVDFALDRETKARDFYKQCMEQASRKEIKDFFRSMADEEESHRQKLLALDTSDLTGAEPAQVEDLQISDFMKDVKFTPDIDYQKALTLAMKKEEKAHEFYSAWQNKCGEAKTSEVFALLAGEELKHKRKLEEMYDSDILMWD